MSFRVENLSVVYGGFTAVSGVDLEFESGALGLLGPNGAGKSSLLRALLGFVRPATGRVSVLGLDAQTDSTSLRRRLGYAPEDDALLPGLTGVAAVALCARLSGLPRVDALQRAHEMLHFVGLGEVRYRRVETYSQGMRQRLKLAQAIVHDPELLILDEPTNGLDPAGRQEMLRLIRDLALKGIRIVLSSHLLPDVEAVCDQIAVMDTGRLVRSGFLADLLGQRSRAYEVRVKGDLERFLATLTARQLRHELRRQGLVFVEPADDGTRGIFAAAKDSGCQVRHLMPSRTTLGEVFQKSLAERSPRADS